MSNITGSEAVGAFVVWEDGNFIKDDYRLFKIKTVEGIDDFAMIEEVVGRHLNNLSKKKGKLPQLMLIDGGKGQLASAIQAMKHFSLPIEIAAIAKAKVIPKLRDQFREGKPDRIYIPGKASAVPLQPLMGSTRLLQRIRDEAHRFAADFHKKLRTKRVLESPLEKINGIGRKRRLSLLRHFGSIEALKKASVDEISSLKGMNKKTAEHLKASLGGAK